LPGWRAALRHTLTGLALCGAAVGALVLALHLVYGAGARAETGAATGPVTAQPVLGTADRSTVLMGAASAGQPGEAWAYSVLPLEASPPVETSEDAFAATSGNSPAGQLVFEQASDADPNWSIVETPLNEEGQPYRGMNPDRASARITPAGGGLLLGEDASRPSGEQVVVLARDPGGRFHLLPEPSAEVMSEASGEAGGQEGAALALQNGSGAVADAAVESGGKTEAYFGALGLKQDAAIIRWNGEAWSYEPVRLPAGYEGSFTIVSLAGTGPQNMWMLAQASPESGLGVMLFRRVEEAGEASWQLVTLGAPLFEASVTSAEGISKVSALGSPAQSLTVTGQGVWIDGNLDAAGGASEGYDFTLYYDISEEQVTGTWCDAANLEGNSVCQHPFEARFGRVTGYRSFAFEGSGYGSRVITNPSQVGGGSSLGSYLTLEGTSFRRMPGAGPANVPGGAFYTPEDGWLEGPVQITSRPLPKVLASWPVSARAPFNAVTTAPGTSPGEPGAQALAVGSDGVVARYAPGKGWEREFLLNSSGEVTSPTLRAVAWPQKNLAFAVGDQGAMWIWRGETGYWYRDPAAPLEGFQGNLLGLAFAPQDPGTGYAVGSDGTFMKYGKSWTQLKFGAPAVAGEETLPEGLQSAEFTSIAYAGDEALVAAGANLLVNDGSGWTVQSEVHELLASLPGQSSLYAVAGLANGGAVVAGRDVVLERDSAGAPWHFSEQPIVGETAIAAAAVLEGTKVRAVLSVVPEFQYPPTLVLPPSEPNTPGPVIPPNPLPGDGYLLRETPSGWEDQERADYAGVSEDKPVKTDPIAAFDIGTAGSGWVVGGWSGEADNAGRGSDAKGTSAQELRENVQTAAIDSYSASGAPASSPGTSTSQVSLQEGVATFAVAGHAECAEPCASLADDGIAPDRNLEEALGDVSRLSAQSNGPRMLLYTGGRETPGEGPESVQEADRFAQLLGSGGSLPVYAALSAGDSEGEEASAFAAAFSGFSAPFGEGATPSDVSTAGIPAGEATPGPGARTHYAFDSTGPAGTVRVIVIDNSRGSLAASDPYQNPAEAQAPWLERMLADAKAHGIPAIVVGSRELNPNLPPVLNVASDANEEAEIMVKGGASAYLYERPEESRVSSIPAGAKATIPELGTGTLGYRSPIADSFTAGQPDALFGTTGYLLVSVDVAERDPQTNVAPVTARLIPLLQSLSLDPVDGTLLRRSSPALFQGLGRRPIAGDRWGPSSGATDSPEPPGSNPYAVFPIEQCLQSDCASRIEPEYTFTSSEPEIANFVEQDPESTNLRKPLQDSSGHVIPDSKSGILCAFNSGTTTVTISAGGLAYSVPVTVLGGSVEQPCGTVPLSPSRFAHQAAATPSSPPPPPAPAPAPAPAPLAPPPPPPLPAPHVAPPAKAPPIVPPVPLPLPVLIGAVLASSPPPAIPPPPAAAFGRPIPPGGATVRAFEEKREEEHASEHSQAFAAYRPSGHALPQAALAHVRGRGAHAGGVSAYARSAVGAHRRSPSATRLLHAGASSRPGPRPRFHAQPIVLNEGGGPFAPYLLGLVGIAALAGAGIGIESARRRGAKAGRRARSPRRARPAYARLEQRSGARSDMRSKQSPRPRT
jgi:hypothetical protein